MVVVIFFTLKEPENAVKDLRTQLLQLTCKCEGNLYDPKVVFQLVE